MNKNSEFLESIPGFLSLIEKINTEGFFTNIETSITANIKKSTVSHLRISGTGYIPDKKEGAPAGIKPTVDINLIIQNVRNQLENQIKVKSFDLESKTYEWRKYSRDGDTIIGTLGTETNFHLTASFN